MPNRPTERGKSLLLQKEMNQKHCNAKTSTLNGSALSTKCRKYEKVILKKAFSGQNRIFASENVNFEEGFEGCRIVSCRVGSGRVG